MSYGKEYVPPETQNEVIVGSCERSRKERIVVSYKDLIFKKDNGESYPPKNYVFIQVQYRDSNDQWHFAKGKTVSLPTEKLPLLLDLINKIEAAQDAGGSDPF